MATTTKTALRRATETSRRLPALRVVDGRSVLAVQVRRTVKLVLSGLPEPVSETCVLLAEHYAMLQMHLSALDQIVLSGGELTTAQIKQHQGLASQSQRLLRQIHGMKATKGPSGAATSMIGLLQASA